MTSLTVDLTGYIPQLMRAALKVAAQPCEFRTLKNCTLHLAARDWCAPCALRRAANLDRARLNAGARATRKMVAHRGR